MKQPDMLISHDTKILQQIIQGVIGKAGNGAGVSISLPSINQINIFFGMDGEKFFQIKGIVGSIAEGLPEHKEPVSKKRIIEVLESVGWNRHKAAQKLNRTYSALHQRLGREGILPPSGEWPKRLRGRRQQIAERGAA